MYITLPSFENDINFNWNRSSSSAVASLRCARRNIDNASVMIFVSRTHRVLCRCRESRNWMAINIFVHVKTSPVREIGSPSVFFACSIYPPVELVLSALSQIKTSICFIGSISRALVIMTDKAHKREKWFYHCASWRLCNLFMYSNIEARVHNKRGSTTCAM